MAFDFKNMWGGNAWGEGNIPYDRWFDKGNIATTTDNCDGKVPVLIKARTKEERQQTGEKTEYSETIFSFWNSFYKRDDKIVCPKGLGQIDYVIQFKEWNKIESETLIPGKAYIIGYTESSIFPNATSSEEEVSNLENKELWGTYYSISGCLLGTFGDDVSSVRLINEELSSLNMDKDTLKKYKENITTLSYTADEFYEIIGSLLAETSWAAWRVYADRQLVIREDGSVAGGYATVEEYYNAIRFDDEAASFYSLIINRSRVRGTPRTFLDELREPGQINGNRATARTSALENSPQSSQKTIAVTMGIIRAIHNDTDYSEGAYYWHGSDLGGVGTTAYNGYFTHGLVFSEIDHLLWQAHHDLMNATPFGPPENEQTELDVLKHKNEFRDKETYDFRYETTKVVGFTTFMKKTADFKSKNNKREFP